MEFRYILESGSIKPWSAVRLNFESKGMIKQIRDFLKAEISILSSNYDSLLKPIYISEVNKEIIKRIITIEQKYGLI